jgi:hypothetical protein
MRVTIRQPAAHGLKLDTKLNLDDVPVTFLGNPIGAAVDGRIVEGADGVLMLELDLELSDNVELIIQGPHQ